MKNFFSDHFHQIIYIIPASSTPVPRSLYPRPHPLYPPPPATSINDMWQSLRLAHVNSNVYA